MFTAAMFKIMSPRLGQLAHGKLYPPAWLAAVAAWLVVAIVDVTFGFDRHGYRATVWEWLGYGGGSLLVVGWYSGLWSEILQNLPTQKQSPSGSTATATFQDIGNAPWNEIETWLKSDAPAQYDFLENRGVADRVARLISEGTRSVGIVGAFGAGKTSIVTWVVERLKNKSGPGRLFLVCQHSCWGFETSAAAVQDMLGSALSQLREQVDTFQVDSLPESYRKTFSAGGDWIEAFSNLILRNPGPMEQFERLSSLLKEIGGTLVFFVEDLDRNNTSSFDLQEVLAFLERLKEFPNLSFVLTGGLTTTDRIDYAKLCDHIEYLKTVQPHHSSSLISRLFERCYDQAVFPHESLSGADQKHRWSLLSGIMMRDYEELSFPQAVAALLSTPRSLRHALGRTLTAWQTLHGEIEFNHLLALNVLRFGAPECFDFLMRRWDRLHDPPSQRPTYGRERVDGIRKAVLYDWNRTVETVEWSPAAASKVMEFILPPTEYWLGDENSPIASGNAQQGVFQERYWIRAVNESIAEDDVRDQEVIRDIRGWLAEPRLDSDLIQKLTTLPRYSEVWEDLAARLLGNQLNRILLVCEHVLSRILQEQGSNATAQSQGFVNTWRLANRRIAHHEANRQWLMDRITDAATVSIEMANNLWHYYGSGRYSVLRHEDREPVRRHLLDTLKQQVANQADLIARMTPNNPALLYQLVFDPGSDGERILNNVQDWKWLGPILTEAMRERNRIAAANCGVLLGGRVSGREKMTVDDEVLQEFFRDRAVEVIEILDEMIDQIPEADQVLVRNVIAAARRRSAGGPSAEGSTDGAQ